MKTYKGKLSDFEPMEDNANEHTERGMDFLDKSIARVGYLDSMTVSSDNTIISGHARSEIAFEKLGDDVIVVESDGTLPIVHKRTDIKGRTAIAKIASLLANRAHEVNLAWSQEVMQKLEDEGIELGEFWTKAELDELGFNENDVVEENEVPLDKAEELQEKWNVKYGQVWSVGSHEVMCGDSTNVDDVNRLMGGAKAYMAFADPPYGMNLDTDFSGMTSKLVKGKTGNNYHDKIIGDDLPFDPNMVCGLLSPVEVFMWGADYYAERIPDKNKGSWFVWDKRLSEDADKMWGSCFELCWSKRPHKRDLVRIKWAGIFGMETQDTLTRVHANQKPTELPAWFLLRYSSIGDVVYDPFLGSGTTLVACEQTGRIGYGMEIHPPYVSVTLERLSSLGLTPEIIYNP